MPVMLRPPVESLNPETGHVTLLLHASKKQDRKMIIWYWPQMTELWSEMLDLCYKFPILWHILLTHLTHSLWHIANWWNLIITKTDYTYCALYNSTYPYLSCLLILFWLVDKDFLFTYINHRITIVFFSLNLGYTTLSELLSLIALKLASDPGSAHWPRTASNILLCQNESL